MQSLRSSATRDQEVSLGNGVIQVGHTRSLQDVVQVSNVLQGQLVVSSLQFTQSCSQVVNTTAQFVGLGFDVLGTQRRRRWWYQQRQKDRAVFTVSRLFETAPA